MPVEESCAVSESSPRCEERPDLRDLRLWGAGVSTKPGCSVFLDVAVSWEGLVKHNNKHILWRFARLGARDSHG